MAVRKVKQYCKNRSGEWYYNGIWTLIESVKDLEDYAKRDLFYGMAYSTKKKAVEESGAIFMNEMGGWHHYNKMYIKVEEIGE